MFRLPESKLECTVTCNEGPDERAMGRGYHNLRGDTPWKPWAINLNYKNKMLIADQIEVKRQPTPRWPQRPPAHNSSVTRNPVTLFALRQGADCVQFFHHLLDCLRALLRGPLRKQIPTLRLGKLVQQHLARLSWVRSHSVYAGHPARKAVVHFRSVCPLCLPCMVGAQLPLSWEP